MEELWSFFRPLAGKTEYTISVGPSRGCRPTRVRQDKRACKMECQTFSQDTLLNKCDRITAYANYHHEATSKTFSTPLHPFGNKIKENFPQNYKAAGPRYLRVLLLPQQSADDTRVHHHRRRDAVALLHGGHKRHRLFRHATLPVDLGIRKTSNTRKRLVAKRGFLSWRLEARRADGSNKMSPRGRQSAYCDFCNSRCNAY